MSEPLPGVLDQMRSLILDPEVLVKAVASGRRRGTTPRWRRAELRYVDLKSGRHLQVTTYDQTQAFTSNYAVGEAPAAVDELLEVPFGNWNVETTTEHHSVRVTKKLEALHHVKGFEARSARTSTDGEGSARTSTDGEGSARTSTDGRAHDRAKARLLADDDPVLIALGISDKDGRIKPSRQAKYRQVEEFLRQLEAGLRDAKLRTPSAEDPWRIVDLGCGNGYLTFAAQAYLTRQGLPVRVTGVDVKQQSADHNAAVAATLGIDARFVVGTIDGVELEERPDVVMALHACDTATDDALARAVAWQSPLVLAAPCCHHDIAAQLRKTATPAPYSMLTRHGILRERLADTLTDALRASLLRLSGYRVDVVQFVESQHTPRNTMLRAVRTGGAVTSGSVREEYDALVTAWGIRPKLGELLGL